MEKMMKRADEAVAAKNKAEKAQKAALTDFQAMGRDCQGQMEIMRQRAEKAEKTVKERVESTIEGERWQMEKKINRAERAEERAVAAANLYYSLLSEYWKEILKLVEKVLAVCCSDKEPREIREAMDALNPNPVEARAMVLKYGRALWQESEEYWEWNVVDRTEKAMQLPLQEEEDEEQQQQQQHSRGRGWGR